MIKTIIIDDDIINRELLTNLIKQNCSNISIVAQADGVERGLQAIRKHHPDLLLLDISMDDGDAFDLLEHIGKIDFKVIFVTAHEEYAVKAFKFSAVDYLIKPINKSDLIIAINKAGNLLVNEFKLQLTALSSNLKPEESKTIVLKTLENIFLVKVDDILRCQAERNYTMFYLFNDKRLIVSKPLKEYEDLLKDFGFFRVHHSHLVNVSFIERFEKSEGGHVILKDNSKIPVAQRKKEMLFQMFKQL